MEILGVSWKDTMPLEEGFFVYCRKLTREDDGFRIGTAMMTDVPGDRSLDTLYIMVPVEPEQARKIERVFFVTKSEERIVEIEVDKISQEKIDRRK
jgi:hypothetical protein